MNAASTPVLVKEIVTAQFKRGFARFEWKDDDDTRRWMLLGPLDTEAAEILAYQPKGRYEQKYMYESFLTFLFESEDELPKFRITTDDLTRAVLTDVVIDIDSPVSLAHAHANAKNFVRHLCAAYDLSPTSMRYYFTGSKGFHIIIPAGLFAVGDYLETQNSQELMDVVKTFVMNLSYGFECIDSSIYDVRRIIRIPGAINTHSGLRKIELEYGELIGLPMDEISRLSGTNRDFSLCLVPDVRQSALLTQLWMNSHIMHQRITKPRPSSSLRDLFLPAKKGERNHALARLAGLLRSREIELDMAQLICATWNRTLPDPLPDDEVIDTVYRLFTRYTK